MSFSFSMTGAGAGVSPEAVNGTLVVLDAGAAAVLFLGGTVQLEMAAADKRIKAAFAARFTIYVMLATGDQAYGATRGEGSCFLLRQASCFAGILALVVNAPARPYFGEKL